MMMMQLSIKEIDQIISFLQEPYPYDLIKRLEALRSETELNIKLHNQKIMDIMEEQKSIQEHGFGTSPVSTAYFMIENKVTSNSKIYIKSGMYDCNRCKKFFTIHTRLFAGKDKGYVCPYCKSDDYTEQEICKSNTREVGWYPIYLREPPCPGMYDVTIETPDGTRLANLGYLHPDGRWELCVDHHNYQDCFILAWTERPTLWMYVHEKDAEEWEKVKHKFKVGKK